MNKLFSSKFWSSCTEWKMQSYHGNQKNILMFFPWHLGGLFRSCHQKVLLWKTKKILIFSHYDRLLKCPSLYSLFSPQTISDLTIIFLPWIWRRLSNGLTPSFHTHKYTATNLVQFRLLCCGVQAFMAHDEIFLKDGWLICLQTFTKWGGKVKNTHHKFLKPRDIFI